MVEPQRRAHVDAEALNILVMAPNSYGYVLMAAYLQALGRLAEQLWQHISNGSVLVMATYQLWQHTCRPSDASPNGYGSILVTGTY